MSFHIDAILNQYPLMHLDFENHFGFAMQPLRVPEYVPRRLTFLPLACFFQYSYTAPSQIISLDGYADGNTHTQV